MSAALRPHRPGLSCHGTAARIPQHVPLSPGVTAANKRPVPAPKSRTDSGVSNESMKSKSCSAKLQMLPDEAMCTTSEGVGPFLRKFSYFRHGRTAVVNQWLKSSNGFKKRVYSVENAVFVSPNLLPLQDTTSAARTDVLNGSRLLHCDRYDYLIGSRIRIPHTTGHKATPTRRNVTAQRQTCGVACGVDSQQNHNVPRGAEHHNLDISTTHRQPKIEDVIEQELVKRHERPRAD